MGSRIDKDNSRFRKIVKGSIKKELRKFISKGEYLGKKGKNIVSIPVPYIELPRFIYGPKQSGGVGQGDGESGDPIGKGDQEQGSGQAGSEPGDHILEVEITLEELAQMLGEEMELPNIKPKGRENIDTVKMKYNSIRKTGPESLRHFKRTYKAALRRQLIARTYNPDKPIVAPIREDKRYRSFTEQPLPQSNAVIIYMMDVSGSMGEEQKEMVRLEAFWIDAWLISQYKRIETRFIVHDAQAKEVDRETFFHLREAGGTRISSAYELCIRLLKTEYNPDDWNVYPFHFSDGDNWGDDNTECLNMMEQELLPFVNQFSYGQVRSLYGSGQFIKLLRERFVDHEVVVLSEINDRDDIFDSIKSFFSVGR